MRTLIIALMILLPGTALAQQAASFAKPPGIPTAYIQDYNVTIGIWYFSNGLDTYIAEFELHSDGKWYWGDGDLYNPMAFDSDYARLGAAGLVATVGVPRINAILAARFPPIGSGGGSTGGGSTGGGNVQPLDQVNNILGTSYAIKTVNGSAAVSGK